MTLTLLKLIRSRQTLLGTLLSSANTIKPMHLQKKTFSSLPLQIEDPTQTEDEQQLATFQSHGFNDKSGSSNNQPQYIKEEVLSFEHSNVEVEKTFGIGTVKHSDDGKIVYRCGWHHDTAMDTTAFYQVSNLQTKICIRASTIPYYDRAIEFYGIESYRTIHSNIESKVANQLIKGRLLPVQLIPVVNQRRNVDLPEGVPVAMTHGAYTKFVVDRGTNTIVHDLSSQPTLNNLCNISLTGPANLCYADVSKFLPYNLLFGDNENDFITKVPVVNRHIVLPDPKLFSIAYSKPPKFAGNPKTFSSHEPSMRLYQKVYDYLHDSTNLHVIANLQYQYGMDLAGLLQEPIQYMEFHDNIQQPDSNITSFQPTKTTTLIPPRDLYTISEDELTLLPPSAQKMPTDIHRQHNANINYIDSQHMDVDQPKFTNPSFTKSSKPIILQKPTYDHRTAQYDSNQLTDDSTYGYVHVQNRESSTRATVMPYYAPHNTHPHPYDNPIPFKNARTNNGPNFNFTKPIKPVRLPPPISISSDEDSYNQHRHRRTFIRGKGKRRFDNRSPKPTDGPSSPIFSLLGDSFQQHVNQTMYASSKR